MKKLVLTNILKKNNTKALITCDKVAGKVGEVLFFEYDFDRGYSKKGLLVKQFKNRSIIRLF